MLVVPPVAAAPSQGDDVAVEIEAGIGGVVPAGTEVPVRITLLSSRSRDVVLTVDGDSDSVELDVELAAGEPALVPLSLQQPIYSVTAEVSAERRLVGTATVEVDADPNAVVVGVGDSLADSAPPATPTVAGIQQATLVPMDDELWELPGALTTLSGLVVAEADLDALSEGRRRQLAAFVWNGGDVAVDGPTRAELPILDVAATGSRTAVGAGWMRFTDGAAAAGRWSEVVEPGVVRASVGRSASTDMYGEPIPGLVRIDFLPTWVVAVAVFGTALLAGPVLYAILGSHARRRWLWVAAPGLSVLVAVALLAVGHRIFTRAEAFAIADVVVSPSSAQGAVASGLLSSTEVVLSAGASVLDAEPEPSLSSDGMQRTARVDLARNAFGSLSLEDVLFDEWPRLDVTAAAATDGTALVTIVNRSESALRDVTVSGSSHTVSVDPLAAGEERTIPFEVTSGVDAAGSMYPWPDSLARIPAFGRSPLPSPTFPASRGLVVVTGSVDAPIDSPAFRGIATVVASVAAPIAAGGGGPASLRIDELGSMSAEQLEQQQLQQVPPVDPDGAMPLIAPEEAGAVVRMTAPGGRPAGPCAVHTMASDLSTWDGAAWVPAEPVGGPHRNPRLRTQGGTEAEVQDWELPAIADGQALYVRIGSHPLRTPPALLFDCAGGA